jgi:hypothetical protein
MLATLSDPLNQAQRSLSRGSTPLSNNRQQRHTIGGEPRQCIRALDGGHCTCQIPEHHEAALLAHLQLTRPERFK